MKIIEELRGVGLFVNDGQELDGKKVCFLSNKQIVITGTFPISREKLKKKLEDEYEVIVKGQIGEKTDFLLCGENGSENKLKKARDKNINVIGLDEVKKIEGI